MTRLSLNTKTKRLAIPVVLFVSIFLIAAVKISTTTVVAENLQATALDCTGNANGGAVTTDAAGNLVCSNDDGGGTNTLLWSGSGFINSANQVRYGLLGDNNQLSELRAAFAAPRDGVLKNLYAFAESAVDNGASIDVTVRVNQTDTPLELTIDSADGTSTESNTVDVVAVLAGDLISIEIRETTGNAPSGSSIRATFELEGL